MFTKYFVLFLMNIMTNVFILFYIKITEYLFFYLLKEISHLLEKELYILSLTSEFPWAFPKPMLYWHTDHKYNNPCALSEYFLLTIMPNKETTHNINSPKLRSTLENYYLA